MDNFLFAITLIGLFIFFLWWRKGHREDRRMPSHALPRKKTRRDELYGRLLSQVLGDREKAQRLIKYAQEKNPGFSEEQCIEIASSSLGADIKRWD
jgi:hypothetical protein